MFLLRIEYSVKKKKLEKKIIKIKKALQQKAKGLIIVKLPLLVRFRTFCWGEITEELRNTYKLKELISLPVRAINSV